MSRTDDAMILANAVEEGKIKADRQTVGRYRELMAGSNGAAYRKLLTAPVEEGGLAAGQALNGQQPVGLGGPETYPAEWTGRSRRAGRRAEVEASDRPQSSRNRVFKSADD